ncbi:hypothetical protein [Nonlabens ponticola]|uniref:C1q domain-containing protein n=1 Tax=Nonlabens ponticola TaxID=2496866 RepID=A0A3S9MXE4_9FLAO|nr:hypothetical protein [Nonlabens ponticola]AZQ43808.1 hypothetical protein EJ995_06030 [Nonlabens ponticola]
MNTALKISIISKCLGLLLMASCNTALAQVAIGIDSPANGTMLHVDDPSNSSGVLLPSTALTDLNNTAPLPLSIEEGTLVFNTNADLGKGYYYWDGNRWQRLNAYVGQMAKYENETSGTSSINLNPNSGRAIVPLLASVATFNDNAMLYNRLNSGELQVLESGRYQISVGISLTATTNKSEIEARLYLSAADGSAVTGKGALYRSTELNATSTATENGSISFTQTIEVTAGQIITIRTNRAFGASTGPTYLRDNGSSFFFIEKLI